jgi:hypothetical protein
MDHKRLLGALILGKLPEAEDKSAEEKVQHEAGEEPSREELKQLHDDAVDDVFDALKAGDREAFRKAMPALVRVCMVADKEGLYDEEEEQPAKEG